MNIKRNKLFSVLAFFLIGMAVPAISFAAAVSAECAYTDVDLVCYVYVDTSPDSLVSGGVKLTYLPAELSNPVATKNDTDWFFGDGTTNHPYMEPDVATAGEVVFIVGKLDSAAPTAGVSGARVLVGTVVFDRNSATIPFNPTIGLTLGRDDGPDGYVNFVNTTGADLDSLVTGFATTSAERGDANADGFITNSDYIALRNDLIGGVYRVYSDCNQDGFVTNSDYVCVRNKL